jgi:hypothetical protein
MNNLWIVIKYLWPLWLSGFIGFALGGWNGMFWLTIIGFGWTFLRPANFD